MTAYIGEGLWDLVKLKKLGYKTGSILRVKMINFLTYDEAEVFPGPRLNVLLGPNGTGKSTVTHAICLACGGNGATVGRSPELNQFVKHGKEGDKNSFCEIDVLKGSGEVATIRRVINSDNKSSMWYLNKSKTNEKAIKELMKELNIDVNNLCSFMAQDKVGKFTQFSAKEVLENTLKSIVFSEKTLRDEQVELASIEDIKRAKERVVEAKRKERIRMNLQVEQMQVEVDRMKNREVAKDRLKMYETKLTVLEAREGDNLKKEKQAAVDEAQRALIDAEQTIKPLEKRHTELLKQQTKRDKEADQAEVEFRNAEKLLRVNKEKIEALDLQVGEAKGELELLDARRKQDEMQHEQAKREVEKTRQSLEKALEAVPALKEQLESFSSSITQLSHQERDLVSTRGDLHDKVNQKTAEIAQLNREMSGLKDYKQVFRNRLQQAGGQKAFTDAVALMDLIERNKEQWLATGQLQQEVYGPVAMYIKVNDPVCGAMIEKAVPIAKLFSVVVLTDADRCFLKAECDRLKLKPNVYTMKNLTSYPPPLPQESLAQFEEIGMQGYLLDQLDCPRAVRVFLESFCSLSTVFWARQSPQHVRVTERHDIRLGEGNAKMGSYKLYIQRGNDVEEHVISKSRYAHGNVSINTNTVRPGRILGAGGEEISGKRNELEQRTNDAKQQRDGFAAESHQISTDIDGLLKQLGELKQRRAKIQSLIEGPKTLQNNLASQQKKANDIAKRLQGDIVKERDQKRRVYGKAIESFLVAMEDTLKAGQGLLGLDINKTATTLAKRELTRDIVNASAAVQDARDALKQFQHDLEYAKKDREEAQKRFAAAEEKLHEIKEEMGEYEFGQYYLKVRKECLEDTADAIQDAIYALRAEIDAAIDNPQVLERYESLRVKLAEADVELQALGEDYDDVEKSLQGRLEDWILKVENLASKLNVSFGSYMEKLKYRGEVVLKRQGSIAEFEMQMRVGFRANTAIADLSGHQHSGGERAVSTIMYLMALQEMTSAPFRVVDEINQGMDEANERNVFDRIVTECCGDTNKPQYFLVSPKLLQGLRAMEHNDVTVLMVLNGPGVTTKWTIAEALKEIKEEKGIPVDEDDDGTSEEEEDDDDSPPVKATATAAGGGGAGGASAAKRKKPSSSSSSSASASASAGPVKKARKIDTDEYDD